jgi:hypothetical protein
LDGDGDEQVVISNDGATIMKTLEIVHPAAMSMVDIAKSQDSEVSATPHALDGHLQRSVCCARVFTYAGVRHF